MLSPTESSPAISLLESTRYPGIRLSGSPSSQGTTAPLSGGELSGDTTAVDLTDCSDAPPSQRALVRDESGGSWWSLEEQNTAPERSRSMTHPDNNEMNHLKKRRWKGDNGSAGSAGCVKGNISSDSSEDDGSEESLGQAEEEVAALLVHLGRSNPFFEGFI